jgi:hypothetical protein
VRVHPPIDPVPFRALGEEEALAGLLAELRRRVERSLLPGVKADLRTNVLYLTPPPRPRAHELLAPAAYAAVMTPVAGPWLGLAPVAAYLAYLATDLLFVPQSRFAKRVRNASALLFTLLTGPLALRALGLPLAAPGALAAAMAGAWLPHLYERGQVAVRYVRGGVLACLFGVGALALAPLPAGLHVALSVYAAAFAWDRRTIFWRYTVPATLFYAVAAALLLGGGAPLALHAAAGLGGWLGTRSIPYHRPSGAPPPGAVVGAATGPRAEGREPTT